MGHTLAERQRAAQRIDQIIAGVKHKIEDDRKEIRFFDHLFDEVAKAMEPIEFPNWVIEGNCNDKLCSVGHWANKTKSLEEEEIKNLEVVINQLNKLKALLLR